MATTSEWHDRVTASIGGAESYGKGIWPNPYYNQMAAHERRERMAPLIAKLTKKIAMLSEPRFHTGSETSELMESLITMTSATQILELGTHTARSTLHFLRAIVGIPGAQVVSIDARPTHDREFFAQPEIAKHFQFISGWTPQCLEQLHGRLFDFVFIDSDHSLEHSEKELEAVWKITRPGSMICWHDMPRFQSPVHKTKPPVRLWLEKLLKDGVLEGMILPSPLQLDCREEFGEFYDVRLNPGLAVTIRPETQP